MATDRGLAIQPDRLAGCARVVVCCHTRRGGRSVMRGALDLDAGNAYDLRRRGCGWSGLRPRILCARPGAACLWRAAGALWSFWRVSFALRGRHVPRPPPSPRTPTCCVRVGPGREPGAQRSCFCCAGSFCWAGQGGFCGQCHRAFASVLTVHEIADSGCTNATKRNGSDTRYDPGSSVLRRCDCASWICHCAFAAGQC